MNDGPNRGLAVYLLSWFFFIMGLLAIVIVVLTSGSWIGKWLTKPGEIFDADKVQADWQFAYDTEEDLIAAARMYCKAVELVDLASNDNERAQRMTQAQAIALNYDRIASDYNARLRDAFRAGWTKPPDVRERAPTLVEMIVELDLDCQ